MVPKTPPKMQRRALVALNPNQVRETLKKVDHCMARLQELQCIVTGRSEVVSGVNQSPRSTSCIRCKQETDEKHSAKKSPVGKFQRSCRCSQHRISPPKPAAQMEFQIIHTLMSHFVTPILNESEAEEADNQDYNAAQQQIDNLIAHQQVADPADQLSAGANAALAAQTSTSHFVTPILNESEAEEADNQDHNAAQQQIDNLIAHQQVADPADQLSAGTNAALAAHTSMSHFVTPILNESEAEEADNQDHNAAQLQIENLIAHQQVADPTDQLSAGTNAAALAAHTEPGISWLDTISTTAHLPLHRSMRIAAKKASSPQHSIRIASKKKGPCSSNSKKPKKRKKKRKQSS